MTATSIRRRADLLRRLRQFFDQLGFVEVQTPLLASEIIPEEHIEPFMVPNRSGDQRNTHSLWLQASPEAHMKRLLVQLAAEERATEQPIAIYQITRSFRAGEHGPIHRPEFTIVEWYCTGDDMAAGMDLLDALCRDVADARPAKRTSYHEAFQRHVGIDPHLATVNQLSTVTAQSGIDFTGGTRDDLLNLLLVKLVEPQLGAEAPEILYDYPASQASLAKLRTRDDGVSVAERFELYWRGIELANGYHELTDARELRRRFESVNSARAADGRAAIPMPEQFLAAIEQGLPPCTGVALGFDRLLMVASGATELGASQALRSQT
jgi:lysyl-tRNA synthetase class 2